MSSANRDRQNYFPTLKKKIIWVGWLARGHENLKFIVRHCRCCCPICSKCCILYEYKIVYGGRRRCRIQTNLHSRLILVCGVGRVLSENRMTLILYQTQNGRWLGWKISPEPPTFIEKIQPDHVQFQISGWRWPAAVARHIWNIFASRSTVVGACMIILYIIPRNTKLKVQSFWTSRLSNF